MPENFNFEDSPEFVWVDLPDNEFADSEGVSNIIRLAYPVAVNMSTIYKCLMVRGGKVLNINRSVHIIRIGRSCPFIGQLQAERVDTGESVIFTPQQMAEIERVKLCLEPGKVIDSETGTIGLGADKPFDHTVDQNSAKLVVAVGGTAEIIPMAGNYPDAHLDVYFAGKTSPVPCAFPPVRVLAGD